MSGRRYLGVFAFAVALAAAAGVLMGHRAEVIAHGEAPPRFVRLTKIVPPYPGAAFYPMGHELHFDGWRREMGYAVTRDRPAKVVTRYEAIWRGQGLTVERYRRGGVESVTAQDGRWMRTIMASPQPRGTVIVASVSGVAEAAHPLRLPIPPACEVAADTGALDRDGPTEAAALACGGFVAEVVDFYDELLEGAERHAEVSERGGQVVYRDAHGLEVRLLVHQASLEPPRVGATLSWQEQR